MLGKIEGRRRRGWQKMKWLDDIIDLHEFEQAPGIGDGQGGLTCCSSWGHKESDMTEQLNWKLYTCNCISVFLAMLDLYCCIGFSLIAVRWKLLASCSVWACHCGDLLLQSTGSTPVVCGLRCSVACGNLPGLGIKPMSPALAGRFFTTEPPGGSKTVHLDAAHLLSQYESSVIL